MQHTTYTMQHAQWNIAQACEHSTTCRNAVRFAQEARLDMETMAKILAERHPRACLPTAFLFRALRDSGYSGYSGTLRGGTLAHARPPPRRLRRSASRRAVQRHGACRVRATSYDDCIACSALGRRATPACPCTAAGVRASSACCSSNGSLCSTPQGTLSTPSTPSIPRTKYLPECPEYLSTGRTTASMLSACRAQLNSAWSAAACFKTAAWATGGTVRCCGTETIPQGRQQPRPPSVLWSGPTELWCTAVGDADRKVARYTGLAHRAARARPACSFVQCCVCFCVG